MTRTLILLVALCLFPCYAFSQGGVDPDYYKVLPYRLGKISKLTVTTASQKGDCDSAEDSQNFVMTPKLIRYFFQHAPFPRQRA